MTFIFEDDTEEDEELDLSDLFESKEDKAIQTESDGLQFEEDIPERKSLKDPEVRAKASDSRKRTYVSKEERLAQGYSFYCAAQPYNEYEFDRSRPHYSNLCEEDQNRGKISCTCPCHELREYARPESKYIPGSDDEEIILFLD